MSRERHLFEWHLYQQMNKVSRRLADRKLLKRHDQIAQTDLEKLNMAYNQRGKLSLADLKPIGFILQARG